MGVPMEGFFDEADVAFATPTPSTAAHKVPAKAPTPSVELVPREEGTHTEGVGETTPLSAETPAPPKRAISPAAVQTKTASSVLPLVISTVTPLRLSSRLQRTVLLWLLLLPLFPVLLYVVLTQTYPLRGPMTFLKILMMRLS